MHHDTGDDRRRDDTPSPTVPPRRHDTAALPVEEHRSYTTRRDTILKVEAVYLDTYEVGEDVTVDLFWFIDDCYNSRRLHSILGHFRSV